MDTENIPAVSFESLVGEHMLDAVDTETIQVKKWSDYLEDANVIRFRLDGKVYTAVEDPSDGYRSCMDKLFESTDAMRNTFAPVKVLCRINERGEYHANDTLEFIDCVTGKTVLRVGTDNSDDYYPWFVAEWMPENLASNARGGEQGEEQERG
ncbi:MAG TPA: hypothetical protein VF516_03065 [Kofleriaceae bacterium]